MIKHLALAFVLCLSAGNAFADTTLIAGTYHKGSNATEPQPQQSTYLRTIVGGVAVSDKGVSYVMDAEITKPFDRPMFLRAEFENPSGKAPFTEEAQVPAGQRDLRVVHGPVKGLQVPHTYWIKLYVYEVNDHSKPIDVLTQNIHSYVDTTGDKVVVKGGMTGGKK